MKYYCKIKPKKEKLPAYLDGVYYKGFVQSRPYMREYVMELCNCDYFPYSLKKDTIGFEIEYAYLLHFGDVVHFVTKEGGKKNKYWETGGFPLNAKPNYVGAAHGGDDNV